MFKSTHPEDQNQPNNPVYALWSVLIGFFLITMLMFVVTVALPKIREDLGASESGILWIVNSYTLMVAALLLVSGGVTDRFGARNTFGAGMILFLISSIACALSPDVAMLVAFRVLQGGAAALMLPATLALIRQVYTTPVARGRAIGLWATGAAVGSALGPLMGGALLTYGWRMIFVALIPFCVISLACLTKVDPSPTSNSSFDVASSLLSFATIFSLVYWLIEGGTGGFSEPLTLVAFVAALVCLAMFVMRQLRISNPLIPPSLLGMQSVRLALLTSACFNFVFTGFIFTVSLYFQDLLLISPLETGLALMPVTALSIIFNNVSPRVSERIGALATLSLGLISMAIGYVLVLLVVRGAEPSALAVSLAAMPMGIGGAFIVPVATQVLANGVTANVVGTASGVLNVGRQLASAISVALFGVILARAENYSLGFHLCLVLCIGALVSALLVLHIRFRPTLAAQADTI